jgi:hypothetical protein
MSKNWLRKLALASLLLCPSLALAAINDGDAAPEFPPGVFSDGGHYTMSDFQGKALVFVFLETGYPGNKSAVADWNKLVEQYKDKPVKFIAVMPHNTLPMVQKYVAETRLNMPVFVDNLNILEAAWGQNMNMGASRAFRIVGPEGKVVGHEMTADGIDKALTGAAWKFKDKGYDAKLAAIVNLLEWNQYQPAVKQLMPLAKNKSTAPLAVSATKLYGEVEAEGEAWKTQADGLVASDPVQAYDLYMKVSTIFAGDKLAKSVADPLKKLKAQKPVADELAARTMFEQLNNMLPRATSMQREDAEGYCKQIVAKYPDAPTAKKADALVTTIGLATITYGKV